MEGGKSQDWGNNSNTSQPPPVKGWSTQPPPVEGWSSPVSAQGWSSPPPAYSETVGQSGPPVITRVVHVTGSGYGEQPVTTVCTNCQAHMTTSTTSETGVMAWIMAAVLCAVGLWCCAPIPLCTDSLQDVTHRCSNCNMVVGRFKGSL
eukprot:GFUD01117946.1.p1 GENE.GFUD01117946.1~~GFUD01117946.1.p1  ORF type:complete len:148 (+),score=38.60 GFUD01117946.1:210-653(+)